MNPNIESTILINPSERRIVQKTSSAKKWSEVIREVKTVDNPLSPGDKIERPIYFDHSLINSRQDALILSDRNLDPHEVEKLVGQGFWTAVD